MVVVIVNTALRKVVRLFSLMEKHATYTDYNLSVAFKLLIARFVNSSVVPLVANASISYWFGEGGLCSVIFYVMLSIAFINPIMYIFDGGYFIKLI